MLAALLDLHSENRWLSIFGISSNDDTTSKPQISKVFLSTNLKMMSKMCNNNAACSVSYLNDLRGQLIALQLEISG